MTVDEYSLPAHVTRYIKDAGYAIDTRMQTHIQAWFDWYSCKADFYTVGYVTTEGKRKTRRRLSTRPAKSASVEFASLLLTDQTQVSVGAPHANAWLSEYLDRANFWPTGQQLVEKAFALGTAAWALWFDVREDEAAIKIRRYDARMIVPLSWDEEGVSECAFATKTMIAGKAHDQLQMHVVDGGEYHIKTALWRDGREVDPESVGAIADFPTGCGTPTFGIVRPAVENTAVDLSPYGMSVFADAIDAARAVDLAFDSIFQEVELTGVKVFVDEALIDIRTRDGKAVPIAKTDERTFRKMAGKDARNFIDVFSPDIRLEPLRQAFDVALAKFGDLCGFGQQYFMLDRVGGGLKTATEVVSDNSRLMRNVRKHENAIRGAIQDIVTALLTCARTHAGAPVEDDFGAVSVDFDDSVIIDTQTEKTQMMAEIAAGLIPKWMYAARFYGMSEDEARAALPADEIVDVGM